MSLRPFALVPRGYAAISSPAPGAEPGGIMCSAPARTRRSSITGRAPPRTGVRGSRVDIQVIERVRLILLDQAELFEDPSAYAAGVEDALDAVVDVATGAPDRAPLTTVGGWFG